MRLTTALVAIAIAGIPCSAAFAGPNDLLGGGQGPKKVLKAQLGIKGPKTNACPNEASITGWVFTNYAGPVQVMIVRKGQGVGQPVTIEAVKAANGQYMATFTRTFQIVAPIDAEYRLLVSGGSGVTSNWAPLKARCGLPLPGLDLGPGG
jgi:hypothetical protein